MKRQLEIAPTLSLSKKTYGVTVTANGESTMFQMVRRISS
jgi:hypothetical protein